MIPQQCTPRELAANVSGINVSLRWKPPFAFAACDFHKYVIERGTGSTDSFVVIGERLDTWNQEFHDMVPPGTNVSFAYRVRAGWFSGAVGPPSNVVRVSRNHLAASVGTSHRGLIAVPASGERGQLEVAVPIVLESVQGLVVAGMTIHLSYDPAVLLPVGVKPSVVAAALQIVSNIEAIDQSPGLVQISLISLDGAPLVGLGRFLDVVFQVLPGATADGSWTLTFEKFRSSVLVEDENGVPHATELQMDLENGQFVATELYRRGDVTGDGDVVAGDAVEALLIATGYREATDFERIAGDVDWDGEMTAGDVVGILRLSVGLPINPDPAERQALAATLPSSYFVRTGTVVWKGEAAVDVDVRLDDAAGVAGVNLELGWSSSAIALTGVRSSVNNMNWRAVTAEGGGGVEIALSKDTALSPGALTMATLTFTVDPEAMAREGKVDIQVGRARLFGTYGEDLGWSREVDAAHGWIGTAAAVVPLTGAVLGVLALLVVGAGVTLGRGRRSRAGGRPS